MTLTPAILSTIGNLPREVQGEIAVTYLEARDRGTPEKRAWGEALQAGRVLMHGMGLTPEEARKLDTEAWVHRQVESLWVEYVKAWEGYFGTPCPFRLEHLNRRKMIRTLLAKWRKDSGRISRPGDCVRDQIRGAFLVARLLAEETGGEGMRLDPEFVLEVKGKGSWKRVRSYAEAWWAHSLDKTKEER